MNESYREWKAKVTHTVGFWEIIDRNWTPAEQNELAREWKNKSVT